MSDEQQQQQPQPEPKPQHNAVQQPSTTPSGPPKGYDMIDWVQKSQQPEVTRKDRDNG